MFVGTFCSANEGFCSFKELPSLPSNVIEGYSTSPGMFTMSSLYLNPADAGYCSSSEAIFLRIASLSARLAANACLVILFTPLLVCILGSESSSISSSSMSMSSSISSSSESISDSISSESKSMSESSSMSSSSKSTSMSISSSPPRRLSSASCTAFCATSTISAGTSISNVAISVSFTSSSSIFKSSSNSSSSSSMSSSMSSMSSSSSN